MADDEKLKRERAGTYRTADGRFTIEQSSSGWLVLDEEHANELGLPLTRGPFPTLDGARAAVASARAGDSTRAPALEVVPSPKTGGRNAASPAPPVRTPTPTSAGRTSSTRTSGTRERAPVPPEPVIRELRTVDGPQLRALWAEAGFSSVGDDDLALARMARRNPGLLLVAAQGTRIIGSALGAWDGRRGRIYHVAVAPAHRRRGIATRLVAGVEAGLRALGCPRVSIHISDDNTEGQAFWRARGYAAHGRQYNHELDD